MPQYYSFKCATCFHILHQLGRQIGFGFHSSGLLKSLDHIFVKALILPYFNRWLNAIKSQNICYCLVRARKETAFKLNVNGQQIAASSLAYPGSYGPNATLWLAQRRTDTRVRSGERCQGFVGAINGAGPRWKSTSRKCANLYPRSSGRSLVATIL